MLCIALYTPHQYAIGGLPAAAVIIFTECFGFIGLLTAGILLRHSWPRALVALVIGAVCLAWNWDNGVAYFQQDVAAKTRQTATTLPEYQQALKDKAAAETALDTLRKQPTPQDIQASIADYLVDYDLYRREGDAPGARLARNKIADLRDALPDARNASRLIRDYETTLAAAKITIRKAETPSPDALSLVSFKTFVLELIKGAGPFAFAMTGLSAAPARRLETEEREVETIQYKDEPMPEAPKPEAALRDIGRSTRRKPQRAGNAGRAGKRPALDLDDEKFSLH